MQPRWISAAAQSAALPPTPNRMAEEPSGAGMAALRAEAGAAALVINAYVKHLRDIFATIRLSLPLPELQLLRLINRLILRMLCD